MIRGCDSQGHLKLLGMGIQFIIPPALLLLLMMILKSSPVSEPSIHSNICKGREERDGFGDEKRISRIPEAEIDEMNDVLGGR